MIERVLQLGEGVVKREVDGSLHRRDLIFQPAKTNSTTARRKKGREVGKGVLGETTKVRLAEQ